MATYLGIIWISILVPGGPSQEGELGFLLPLAFLHAQH